MKKLQVKKFGEKIYCGSDLMKKIRRGRQIYLLPLGIGLTCHYKFQTFDTKG